MEGRIYSGKSVKVTKKVSERRWGDERARKAGSYTHTHSLSLSHTHTHTQER